MHELEWLTFLTFPSQCPIYRIPGRVYPVDIVYCDLLLEDDIKTCVCASMRCTWRDICASGYAYAYVIYSERLSLFWLSSEATKCIGTVTETYIHIYIYARRMF